MTTLALRGHERGYGRGRGVPGRRQGQQFRLGLRVRQAGGRLGDRQRQTAKLTAADGAAYDYFGSSVAVSGDTVVVGAYGDDDKGSNSGSAYVFVKPGGGWATTQRLQPPN